MNILPSSDTSETSSARTLLQTTLSALRRWQQALIVLMVGLMITAAATMYMTESVERIAEREFISRCNEIQSKITDRLNAHARILQSGVALFDASETVTREEWRIFIQQQKFEQQLPGIQGIGFLLLIPREELSRHVLKIHREGFPEYKVHPDGDRTLYSSIVYLEPFSGRNLPAFGYDMLSESTSREAMERARDTDAVALSGKVVLIQETSAYVQDGILMYAPVYRKGMPVETVEQRRAAIYGWVYSPYRMTDLMQGILGDRNLENEKQLHLQLFAGVQPSPQTLLYEFHPAGDQKLLPDVRFTRQIPVDFNGHSWTLRFTQTGGEFSTVGYMRVWLTMVGGTLITLLLSVLILALLNTRAKARRMAENMTIDLKEREQFTTDVLDSLPSHIAVLDLDGIIVAVNEPWRNFAFENSDSDSIASYLGKNYLDACRDSIDGESDEGAEAALKGIHAVLQGEQDTFAMEYPCHSPAERRWFIMRVSRLMGSRQGVVVSHTNITERKHAEEALQDLNAYNRTIIEASLDSLVTIDPEGKIFDVNSSTEQVTGYLRQELIGTDFSDYFTEPEKALNGYQRVFKEGLIRDYPLEIRHRDGHITPVLYNATVYHDISGNIRGGVFASARDITERKLAEKKIKRFANIMELSLSEIYIFDAETLVFTAINKSAQNNLGYSNKELRKMKPLDINPELTHENFEKLVKPLRSGSVGKIEFTTVHRRKDGTIYPVEVHLQLIGGETPVFIAFILNITERKKSETELTRYREHLEELVAERTSELSLANDKLRELERLKSMFIASMSHELRTPLSSVIGFSSILLNEWIGPLNDEQKNSLTSILRSGKHLLSLINDVIDVSKIEAGVIEVGSDDFDLADLLAEMEQTFAREVQDKRLFLTVQELHVPMLTDRRRLLQCILNLVSNAIKFTEQGGVTVAVRHDEEQGEVTIAVTDTGIGIEEADQSKLFHAFSRIPSPLSSKVLGTGLGLYLTQKIILEILHGAISVTSEPGSGSTFSMSIPSRLEEKLKEEQVSVATEVKS
jgi:PAS domain S-box-containing protein